MEQTENQSKTSSKGDFGEGYNVGYIDTKKEYTLGAKSENSASASSGWVFIVFMLCMLVYLWKSSKRTEIAAKHTETAVIDQKAGLEEARKTNQLLAEILRKLDKS